jgi:trans-aconitate 2-methyltransferase
LSGGDQGPYAFGDTATAAERLGLVARVFEPATRSFLARVGPRTGRVLDVGCGPGHTSRLLAGAFPDASVIGLDQSTAFLAEARRTAATRTSFEQADVTVAPLPHAPAETIFARLILSHLRERPAALRAWFESLAPGGLLLVEDPESIETTDEVFRTYLRIAGGLIADRGGDLYVGRELGAMAAALGGRVRHDDVETVTPTTGEVATIFGLNLSVWRADPWVTANNESSALGLLADALAARRGMADRGRITWRMRQTAVERT